jgi:hypothetical protein
MDPPGAEVAHTYLRANGSEPAVGHDVASDSQKPNTPEANIQSFIVKVWIEEAADRAGEITWRGQVTHVPGGERRGFQDLDDLAAFVRGYLEKMGVETNSHLWAQLSISKNSHPKSRLMSWLVLPTFKWKRVWTKPPSSNETQTAQPGGT